MSLTGSFETLSVTDVLGLLASGHKTGALHLDAEGINAVVSFADGSCCAVEVGGKLAECESASELSARLRDIVLDVMRARGGRFEFDAE